MRCARYRTCFHHVAKDPQCQNHGVQAITVASDNQSSTASCGSGHTPSYHAQHERDYINDEHDEVQHVPAITKRMALTACVVNHKQVHVDSSLCRVQI